MGTTDSNCEIRRTFQNATFVRDREQGSGSNVRFVQVAGESPSPSHSASEDVDLITEAAVSESAFGTEASSVWGCWWSGLDSADQEDVWKCYKLTEGGTVRVLRVHRVAPPLNDTSSGMTQAEVESLQDEAQVSEGAFGTEASDILGTWWDNQPALTKEAFFENFEEL